MLTQYVEHYLQTADVTIIIGLDAGSDYFNYFIMHYFVCVTSEKTDMYQSDCYIFKACVIFIDIYLVPRIFQQ